MNFAIFAASISSYLNIVFSPGKSLWSWKVLEIKA